MWENKLCWKDDWNQFCLNARLYRYYNESTVGDYRRITDLARCARTVSMRS